MSRTMNYKIVGASLRVLSKDRARELERRVHEEKEKQRKLRDSRKHNSLSELED